MSTPHIPPELLDHVVDHLHDTKDALRNCCLVSKSWIPRTRKHLFADIRFQTKEDLESWKETFPNPSTSPARYTKSLLVYCLHVVTATDGELGGWIRNFSHVVHLRLSKYDLEGWRTSLLPFRSFSPVVKSLHLDFDAPPFPPTFDLILSFPLLEDLAINFHDEDDIYDGDGSDEVPTVIQPSNPPTFTGSLELATPGLMVSIIPQLLSQPSGIHFRRFAVRWNREADILPTIALVEGCSHTLESLDITCKTSGVPIRCLRLRTDDLLWFPAGSAVLDLSKATKLQDMDFRLASLSARWINAAIQTTTPKHQDLRKITIHIPYFLTFFNVDYMKGSGIYREWLDLDRLMVQLWESRSPPPRVICTTWKGQSEGTMGFADCLLPELTRRGIVNLGE